jgi:glycopeptide antibiotics resistance protein
LNYHGILSYLSDYALFGPGLLITIVVSLAVARPLARRIGAAPFVGLLLVLGLGLIVSATLTPSRDALRFGAEGTGQCQLTPIDLDAIAAMFQFGDPGFNFLLFVPFGLAIGLMPASRIRTRIVIGAFLLSPLIELTQLVVTPLDRACQSSDVFDNIAGLIAGLAIGWLIRIAFERIDLVDEPGGDRSVGP